MTVSRAFADVAYRDYDDYRHGWRFSQARPALGATSDRRDRGGAALTRCCSITES
ncbi:hypothetical protein R5M92_09915 [Halomonas sp. Bachu 37]|uniref:hypothetical protein n=1 Tax=Halomonas kashgarensis TaxID=3084920 RepID=UPI003217EC7A